MVGRDVNNDVHVIESRTEVTKTTTQTLARVRPNDEDVERALHFGDSREFDVVTRQFDGGNGRLNLPQHNRTNRHRGAQHDC